MAKSQRTKGAGGEREWCALLARHGFASPGEDRPKRLLGQARDGGGDVYAPPFLWEVKRRHRIAVYDFLRQCQAACTERGDAPIPAVALRADNQEWLVLMRAEDVLSLLRRGTNLTEAKNV